MILRELVNMGADIDFLARAPAGKEVEELTRKEVMKCLKNKLPFEQGDKGTAAIPSSRNTIMPVQRVAPAPIQQAPPRPPEPRRRKRENIVERVGREAAKLKSTTTLKEEKPSIVEKVVGKTADLQKPGPKREIIAAAPKPPIKKIVEKTPPEPARKLSKEELTDELKELSKTLKARFYDSEYVMIKELPVREVIKSLGEVEGIYAIVFDGIVTQRLVDLAENQGVQMLVGGKIGNVSKKPTKLELVIPSSKK